MKTIFLTTLYAIALTASATAYAGDDSPLTYISYIHGQRALAATKQMIFNELVQNMEYAIPQSPKRVRGNNGVDVKSSLSEFDDNSLHHIFAQQITYTDIDG